MQVDEPRYQMASTCLPHARIATRPNAAEGHQARDPDTTVFARDIPYIDSSRGSSCTSATSTQQSKATKYPTR